MIVRQSYMMNVWIALDVLVLYDNPTVCDPLR